MEDDAETLEQKASHVSDYLGTNMGGFDYIVQASNDSGGVATTGSLKPLKCCYDDIYYTVWKIPS
jgi:hypothetical protein